MNITLNEIISFFAKSPLQFSDLFITRLSPNQIDGNRFTASYCSGIVLTISGEASFTLNGKAYEMNKNTLLHAGPSMLLEITTKPTNHWEYIVIHYINYNDTQSLSNEHFTLEITANHKIDYFMQQLITFNNFPSDLMNFKCQLYFLQLIETILVHAKMQTANNFVDRAIAMITENYQHPISITEIAETIGCGRRKFTYLFEKQVGMSPIQFLTEYRLKQARTLLRSTQMQVSEIAELVGYSDPYYFCRVFKKHYDVTPTTYRNMS